MTNEAEMRVILIERFENMNAGVKQFRTSFSHYVFKSFIPQGCEDKEFLW